MKIAIITGASSGLGAAFARAVTSAYGALDEIWLIARRRERLEAFAAAYSKDVSSDGADSDGAASNGATTDGVRSVCRFRILAMDLADDASFAELERVLQEVQPEIRVLINNAGYQSAGPFEEIPAEGLDRMIDVNVLAATRLQRLCTPYLTADSISILTASVLAFVPTPTQAVYAATKAYLYSLGRALREEYRGSGHGNVLVLCPGSMDTEMNPKAAHPNRLYGDVDRIAAAALQRAERGASVYTPGIPYKLYRVISKILPQSVLIRIVSKLYS